MKIASITVTSGRASIIGDALLSVSDLVDLMVFVDIGIDMETMKIIKEIAGNRAVFVKSDVSLENMATWRNVGLKAATNFGADWALQLDTDERLHFNGVDVRAALADSDVNVFAVRSVDGNYSRERFFRLPTTGYFNGIYHEEWVGDAPALLPGVTFFEIPKTEERIKADIIKFEYILDEQIRKDPGNHRWKYYKALRFMAVGHYSRAANLFEACLDVEAPALAKAWDCYMMAKCYAATYDHAKALNACLMGLERFPIPECSWMAGVQCLMLGRPQEALSWANMAISNGLYVGTSLTAYRVGNLEPYALWEGPFELQRDCLKVMGYPESDIKEVDELIVKVIEARSKA